MASNPGDGVDANIPVSPKELNQPNTQDSPATPPRAVPARAEDASTAVFVTPAKQDPVPNGGGAVVPVAQANPAKPAGDWVLDFGMYKGSTFAEVYKRHPSYCDWACRQPDPSSRLAELVKYTQERRSETADLWRAHPHEHLWDGSYFYDGYYYDGYDDDGYNEDGASGNDEDEEEEEKEMGVHQAEVPVAKGGRLDELLHRVGSLKDTPKTVATQTEGVPSISSSTQTRGGRISTVGSKRPRAVLVQQVSGTMPVVSDTLRRSHRTCRPKRDDSDDE
jgi:hypothetical protein